MVHKTKGKEFDLVSSIIAFEDGTASNEEVVGLFQHLVDTGQVWGMQGFYGRTAMDLINQGLVKPPKTETRDYYGNVIRFQKVKQRKIK